MTFLMLIFFLAAMQCVVYLFIVCSLFIITLNKKNWQTILP